jgi:hypothetical protein
MPRALIVALLALLALPAGAAAADRCPHRPGERVLARSAQAVVTERHRMITLDGTPYEDVQTVLGCSRRTGARRVVSRLSEFHTDANRVTRLKLAGTAIAYQRFNAYKDFSADTVLADDAVHGGRHRELSEAVAWPYPAEKGTLAFAVAADGTVAWVARSVGRDDQLLVWDAASGLRRRDVGFDLAGPLVLAAGSVRWLHDGRERDAPTALPPTRCAGRAAREGTTEVDLTLDADRLTACLRATGASLTVDGNYRSLVPTVDVAGPYVALSDHGAVRRLDLATSSIETIPVRGSALARVDEAGSLAWYDNQDTAPLLAQLWIRDADGLRAVGDPVGAYAALGRDGATVRHGEMQVTLNP